MNPTENGTAQVLREIQRTLDEIKGSLELIALAQVVGPEARLLGGGVSEADVHQLAVKRLKRLIAEDSGAEARG